MSACQRIGRSLIPAGLLLMMPWGGCTDKPGLPLNIGEPVGPQLTRVEADLRGQPFRALVDFESDADLSMVRADQPLRLDAGHAHTGRRSLAISPGTAKLTVKLSSAFTEAQFPGQWTLAGGYFYAAQPTTISVAYARAGAAVTSREVRISPGKWSAVLVDLSHQPSTTHDARFDGTLDFTFDHQQTATLWCDDIVVINNTRTFVAGAEATDTAPAGWTIQQRGFDLFVTQRLWNRSFKLLDASPAGWTLLEANELRACLSSPGRERSCVLYSDGRQVVDSQCRPVGPMKAIEAALVTQHQQPGEVEVPDTMGKVDRSTPGDQNNDGYNELLGAYQVTASGARIDVTLKPAGARLIRPIIEIAQLPPGKIIATVEGRLVSRVVRTASGHVLVELPGEFDRPVTVNVTVR